MKSMFSVRLAKQVVTFLLILALMPAVFVDMTAAALQYLVEPTTVVKNIYPVWDGLVCVTDIDGYESLMDDTGKVLTARKYSWIERFSEGYAKVYLDGKYGFIDTSGREIVAPKYDYADNFSGGYARVEIDGKYGVIDTSGREIVAPKYDSLGYFSEEGLAAFRVGDWETGKYGFIDTSGREIVAPKYDSITGFSGGFAPVCLDGKWGFIDTSGREIVAPKYDNINGFRESLAVFRVGDWETGKCGFIDTSGREIVAPKYDNMYDFNEGFARVRLDGKWGLTDTSGREIVAPKYDSVYDYYGEYAMVYLDGKYGFIDPSGQEIVPAKYDELGYFSEGLAFFRVGDWSTGKYGFIDTSGREIVAPKYDNTYSFSGGFARVRLDGKWGFIDTSGREIVTPKYDYVNSFSGGFASVYLDGKYGFIDTSGREIVAPKYDSMYLSEGFAQVRLDGKWGVIDTSGQEILPAEFDSILICGNSFYVLKDGKLGVIANNTSHYLYDEGNPADSYVLPVETLEDVNDAESAVEAVKNCAEALSEEEKENADIVDLVTLFAEEAIARASTQAGNGGIVVDQDIRAEQASEALKAVEAALTAAGFNAVRELSTTVNIETAATADLSVTVKASAVNDTVDAVRIQTTEYSLQLSMDTIQAATADGDFSITVTKQEPSAVAMASLGAGTSFALDGKIAYIVEFNKPIEENIKISLPPVSGDPTYQAIINDNGDAVGGKLNPVTDLLEAKIKGSGSYTVSENKKDFTDISAKSQEMQNAINILASKGIINGTSATTFNPDGTITRAEIAALIVRTLSKLDANADGGFTDVTKADWFFGAVGSAKKHGIINGMSATTFAPKNAIQKDQIVAIAARVLRTEMKYKDPSDADAILKTYTDASNLAAWSLTDLALATRENLVVKRTDGKFVPFDTMTRGDAAVVLYRMFMKVW